MDPQLVNLRSLLNYLFRSRLRINVKPIEPHTHTHTVKINVNFFLTFKRIL